MICISSIESDVYNKKKIQVFVVNMTFISSREVKKMYISFVPSALMKYTFFFTSLDEIKVIFIPNIWISSMYELRRLWSYCLDVHADVGRSYP